MDHCINDITRDGDTRPNVEDWTQDNDNTSQPFRFLDLPLEVQHSVYREYCGRYDVIIRLAHDPSQDSVLGQWRLKAGGIPGVAQLELVCHQIFRDFQPVREQCFSGKIIDRRLDNYKGNVTTDDLFNYCFKFPASVSEYRIPKKLQWLRQNAKNLEYNIDACRPGRYGQGRGRGLFRRWPLMDEHFPNLQEVNLITWGIETVGRVRVRVEGGMEGHDRHTLLASLKAFEAGEEDEEISDISDGVHLDDFVKALDSTGHTCTLYLTSTIELDPSRECTIRKTAKFKLDHSAWECISRNHEINGELDVIDGCDHGHSIWECISRNHEIHGELDVTDGRDHRLPPPRRLRRVGQNVRIVPAANLI